MAFESTIMYSCRALHPRLADFLVARGGARGRKTLRRHLRGALRERSPRRGVKGLQGPRSKRQGAARRMKRARRAMVRAWMLSALWRSCQIHHTRGQRVPCRRRRRASNKEEASHLSFFRFTVFSFDIGFAYPRRL